MGIIRRNREFEEGPGRGEGPGVMTNEEKYSDFDNTTGGEKNRTEQHQARERKKTSNQGNIRGKLRTYIYHPATQNNNTTLHYGKKMLNKTPKIKTKKNKKNITE